MALSAKQLAMAWINRCLEAERIQPEEEELQSLNGGKPIKEKVLNDAIGMIHTILSNIKTSKFQPYVDKYCQGANNDQEEAEENRVPDNLQP